MATSILDRAAESLGGFLPRLGGALVLLLVGILVARLIGRLVGRALHGAGIDELSERFGVADALASAQLDRSLSRLIGQALRLALSAIVVFAALSLLGLQFLSDSLNAAVLLLPNLAVAAALILAGVVIGGFARERADRFTREMDLPFPLGRAVQIAVIAIFSLTAAAQIAISTVILMALVGILLAGIVAMLALSFGLGSSAVAREVTAGRYLRTSFEPGQNIGVGEVRGEIVVVESATTVLRADNGDTIRVPNALLLSSVVTVFADDQGARPNDL